MRIQSTDFRNMLYADTLKLSKSCLSLPSYSLDAVCDALGITLEKHHNALADAVACSQIFWNLQMLNPDAISYDAYELKPKPKNRELKERSYCLKTKAEQQIFNVIDCCIDNKIVTESSIHELSSIFQKVPGLSLDELWAPINNEIRTYSSHPKTSTKRLLAEFRKLRRPTIVGNGSLKQFSITGKKICLTGGFYRGPRKVVMEEIEKHGAAIMKQISGKCDYLVVGQQGSEAYAYGSQGTKILKAQRLQAAGKQIVIIREKDFFSKLNDDDFRQEETQIEH